MKQKAAKKVKGSILSLSKGRTDIVACHGCGDPIEISTEPILIRVGLISQETFLPCLKAPHICPICRRDRKKLAEARAALEKHFEQGDHERRQDQEHNHVA